MGLSAKACAEIRADAEKALVEDADYGSASARELLLNEYRTRFRDVERLIAWGESAKRGTPWTPEDLEGLQWIDALARAGHVGAIRLRARVHAARQRLFELLAIAPAALHEMARHAPGMASFLARAECQSAKPDLDAVLRWLEAGQGVDAQVAAAVRELLAAGVAMGEKDWEILGTFLHAFESQSVLYRHGREVTVPAELVWSFAKQRLDSGDASQHAAGERLLARALFLGSPRARERAWLRSYEAAEDRAAFLRDWFEAHPELFVEAHLPCLGFAASTERGDGGAQPDLEAALPWYERASRMSSRHGYKPGALAPGFCKWVAQAFDRRGECMIKDDALAVRWYERGLEVDSDECMDAWLAACAGGELGLVPDPDAAMARARRYMAEATNPTFRPWRPARGLRLLLERAEAHLAAGEDALAAQWLVVGAFLRHAEAQFRLAGLAMTGRGVKQDASVATNLYGHAAAQGHRDAKAALAALEGGA